MDTATRVNIILCILSFILAAISVITVVITIRQNNRMIKNSTRPYVVMTMDSTNFQGVSTYLVLKNYGNTGAIIKSIKYDIDISEYSMVSGFIPFNHIENMLLAPGQRIIVLVNADKLKNNNISSFTASIEYTDGKEGYKEDCVINFAAYSEKVYLRASTKDKELKIISYTLQDMAEKMM